MSVVKSATRVINTTLLSVTATPKEPGFVFCKVDVLRNGKSMGALSSVAQYVPKTIQIKMEVESSAMFWEKRSAENAIVMEARRVVGAERRVVETRRRTSTERIGQGVHDFAIGEPSLFPSYDDDSDSDSDDKRYALIDMVDRYGAVRVTFDQALRGCNRDWFYVNGWEVVNVACDESTLFETVCDVLLISDFSGMKLLQVNKNRLTSDSLTTNDAVGLNVLYERTRPFVELYDITSGRDVVGEKRVVLASFSRDVSDLQVMKIACEGCIVLDLQRLNTRLFQFSVVANRPGATSIVHCSVMENAVRDESGVGNVRSTPLTLNMYAGDFAVTMSSPQLPITNNSTVTCFLYTSEPLTQISNELFNVKNGFIVALNPTAHLMEPSESESESLESSGSSESSEPKPVGAATYYYEITIRSTVQGLMCVEVVKSGSVSPLSPVDSLVGAESGLRNAEAISMCITVDGLSPYLLHSSPASSHFNAKQVWTCFAFSEPLVLLYNPQLSFTENLQTSTEERVLSMICPPEQTGDCIAVRGGTVITAEMASDRICLELGALVPGRVTVVIPNDIITDLAGNPLRGDVRHSLTVDANPLQVVHTSINLFSRWHVIPSLSLTFNKRDVHVTNDSNLWIEVRSKEGVRTRVFGESVEIRPFSAVFPIDETYQFYIQYEVMVPAGLFFDDYHNYFAGYMNHELSFSSSSYRLFLVLLTLSRFWYLYSVVMLGIGLFFAIGGYRLLYYTVMLNNAFFILCVLSIVAIFLHGTFSVIQNWVVFVMIVAVAGVSTLLSSLIIHKWASVSLRFFTAGIGFYVGVLLFRLGCDLLEVVKEYVTLYGRIVRITV